MPIFINHLLKTFISIVQEEFKKILKDTEYSVKSQDKGYYLFDKCSDEKQRGFALRPDIVINKGNDLFIEKLKACLSMERQAFRYRFNQAASEPEYFFQLVPNLLPMMNEYVQYHHILEKPYRELHEQQCLKKAYTYLLLCYRRD